MTQAEKGDAENGKEKGGEKEKEQRGVKRPIVPALVPESLQEQIQSNFIVVIHPGSTTLRIGRATDTLPASIPHVIARRHKQQGQPLYKDNWLLREGLNKPESNEQRQNGLKMVDQAIWSKKMSNGTRRIPVSPEQARSYNKQMRPAILDHCSGNKWTNTSHHPEFLVGEEALYVNPLDCYNIHWPIRRGQLNIHPGPGGSLTAVLADIEVIWSHAIQKYLEIPLKDLKYYRCILLIPDIYNKQHVKELVNMILMKMGFSGIVVHQESVCATFGSGLSSTCIVDVGDQKTSVCCVEDGVSHRNTRLCLAYGGSDVSRCFYWLMQRAGFPYRECQLTNKMDCLLLQHLKETFCHLDQDISGLQDHEFQIRHPDSPALLYQFRLGDEKLQAPMALFYPATFGIVGQKMTTLQHRSQGDPEDPHDEHYLLATQSKQEQVCVNSGMRGGSLDVQKFARINGSLQSLSSDSILKLITVFRAVDEMKSMFKIQMTDSAKATADRKSASKPIGFEGDLRGQSSDLPERLHSQEVDLGSSQGDCLMPGNDSEEALTALMSRKTAISLFEGKALGLDKAILHSIDCCCKHIWGAGREQGSGWGVVLHCSILIQKLLSTNFMPAFSILVVGGGLMFHKAQEFLQHRILNKMPPSFRRIIENVDVITRPKDMDPRLIAWKGGAVLACLDTTQELWIYQREWQRFGVRMLRERAAFVW
ncbi:Actin-related protein 8 [Camelus dromedarius]|uniref:Actin-related protein 8 n=1 Tax=Camelus dromedarius TaxID=9838 RepID=A0A5N4CYN8_CAMDR|nr:Actin-related protein 8 [Camelus dromedarius]